MVDQLDKYLYIPEYHLLIFSIPRSLTEKMMEYDAAEIIPIQHLPMYRSLTIQGTGFITIHDLPKTLSITQQFLTMDHLE
jgi:hypothetical protein